MKSESMTTENFGLHGARSTRHVSHTRASTVVKGNPQRSNDKSHLFSEVH